MKMNEHEIWHVCKEHDPKKYLTLASMKYGYGKLCCYAVSTLGEKNIITSYENICLALWRMFPKAENFHISGFDDMPDTDYMEKLIKLRSTLSDQGYLVGGNAQKGGREWLLTPKGQKLARQAKSVLSGEVEVTETLESSSVEKGTTDYMQHFNQMVDSMLYKNFIDGKDTENIESSAVCRSLNMLYSSTTFDKDYRDKRKFYKNKIIAIKKDGHSDPKLDKFEEFLSWLDNKMGVGKNA